MEDLFKKLLALPIVIVAAAITGDKEHKEVYAPNCEHPCSGNCRRVGCNCECGEWHGKYEPEDLT